MPKMRRDYCGKALLYFELVRTRRTAVITDRVLYLQVNLRDGVGSPCATQDPQAPLGCTLAPHCSE